MSPVPAHVARFADDLVDAAHEIEFPDEGDRWSDETGDDYVALSSMNTMKYAISNCHAASWAVVTEAEKFIDVPDGLSLVATVFDKPENGDAALFMRQHFAVGVDDGQWVIDFTARQFDKSEDFPLVTTAEEWHARINAHAARLFGQGDGTLVLNAT